MKFAQLIRIIIFRHFYHYKHQLGTEYFQFYFSHEDKSIRSLVDTVEDNIIRITEHLEYNPPKKIKVFIYPDLKSFHYYACGMKDLPSWVVGMAYKEGIRMVTPNHEGTVHSQQEFNKIITHELTHVIVHNINRRIPIWLHEGIAVYEANQVSVKSKEYLKENIEKGNIPTLEQLNCDSLTFGNINGYDWAFTIINYIVENYGYKKLVELIKQPHNFKEIFGYSQIEFEKKWINSVNTNVYD